jgi:Zn-dependent protease
MPNIDPTVFAAILLVIFFAIGLHEYAHAKMAEVAGDPTPGFYGRVTLNLFKHFEPVGTIMIIFTALFGVGIGWGRPVPMDPRRMRNPKWDHFAAVAAGPITNLLQAIVFAIVLRLIAASAPGLLESEFLRAFLVLGVMINLSLCFFNLLPIGPLDGMWLLGTFLPARTREAWTRWNLTAGQFVFLFLVIAGQMSQFSIITTLILPPIRAMFRFLVGAPIGY